MKFPLGVSLLFSIFGTVIAQSPTPTPIVSNEEFIVTVNKIETRIGETPASIVTFSRAEIEAAAAPTVDDILRQSPGFSIFRRSSSRNANPTTQGVSLRGVGSSGASRTVVMFDGVPINDPFGGWVQWNRIPPISVRSVEILRGGASSLYGGQGLSGAVNILPRTATEKYSISADVFGGSQRTMSGAGFATLKIENWQFTATASNFQTRGYRPVEKSARGPIDVFSGVRTNTFSTRLSRSVGKKASIFIVPSYFGEVRTNGTGFQTNRTHGRLVFAGGDLVFGQRDSRLHWRAFAGTQVFDQVFSVINSARNAESLNRIQRVAADNHGISGQFSITAGEHTMLSGIDFRNVRAGNNELSFVGNFSTLQSSQNGRENTTGVFVQDFVRIGDRIVVAGTLRYDRWLNYSAFVSSRTLATGAVSINPFRDRSESAISPKIAVLYRISKQFSFYANASKSFRAPTLNELYRGFRVGSVVTMANENLRSERANNFEAGIISSIKSTTLRANAFWTSVNGAVSNVTLTVTPSLITRQRQNAGQTRSRGFEVEGEKQFGGLGLTAGYLFADSEVVKFPSNRSIEGLLIPQVARHSFTIQTKYSRSDWTFAIQGRVTGNQFDDDQNIFRLDSSRQLDIFVAKHLGNHIQIYTAVENVFDWQYSVGRTPVRTVNSPINLRIGLRLK